MYVCIMHVYTREVFGSDLFQYRSIDSVMYICIRMYACTCIHTVCTHIYMYLCIIFDICMSVSIHIYQKLYILYVHTYVST